MDESGKQKEVGFRLQMEDTGKGCLENHMRLLEEKQIYQTFFIASK